MIRKYIFVAFYWIWIYGEAHCRAYFDLFVFVKKLEIKRQSITFYMAAGTFTSNNGLSESEVSFKIFPVLRVEISQLHGYKLEVVHGKWNHSKKEIFSSHQPFKWVRFKHGNLKYASNIWLWRGWWRLISRYIGGLGVMYYTPCTNSEFTMSSFVQATLAILALFLFQNDFDQQRQSQSCKLLVCIFLTTIHLHKTL